MNEALNIRQALEKYKKIVQPIKGISMLPMLDEDKDAVELVEVKGQLEKYDLPLFQRRNGEMVLHRIIAVKKNHYLICGDNSTAVEKVPMERIVAVASGFYKNGKYVSCKDEAYLAYVRDRWKDFSSRKIIRKLPKEWSVMAALYRMAITGREEKVLVPNSVSWETVYKLCKEQMISAVVYPAVEKTDCPERTKEKFRKQNQISLNRWLLFQAEREAIYRDLAQLQIPHMSLKGILYGPLYPQAGTREMTDNDILIRPEDAQAVDRYMMSRGYRRKPGWVHISYRKKPCYNFEFHTKLFHEERVEALFGDVWERAKQASENGYEYLMSDEDVYLHTVAHFHKHYYWRGAGVRAFADLYLLRSQSKDYDMPYINSKLKALEMQEFTAFYEKTAGALFDGDIGEIDSEAVHYILSSGAFGTVENRARNAIKKQGAHKYFWSRVFLPFWQMRMEYPCLRKLPFLLPIFWVVRLVRSVFNADKRRKMKIELKAMMKKKNG